MALVTGTNCGFVTISPTADPGESKAIFYSTLGVTYATKNISPSNATKITEIGWYAGANSPEANFEVGIYSHNVEDNRPGTLLLGADLTNEKGSTEGWKKVTGLNIPITENTIYWIAVQIAPSSTWDTKIDYVNDAGEERQSHHGLTLPDPWVESASSWAAKYAIYAKVEGFPSHPEKKFPWWIIGIGAIILIIPLLKNAK